MAHMILNNEMAFVGEKPWHDEGVECTPELINETRRAYNCSKEVAMLIIAKMNWEVQRRALAMRDGMGKGLLTDPLANFRAIVRKDTNEVFQVATDKYFPMQNRQIVEFFQQFCDAGHMTLETLGALQGGRKVWALAKLADCGKVIGENDELMGYVLLATSHDGSLQTVAQATQVRVVCWNTLSLALGIGRAC